MTNKEILQADMLDILFEHRNKLYGAYALRKSYTHRLGVALGSALSIVLLFMLMSFIKKNNGRSDSSKDDRTMVLTEVDLKEKIKEPEKQIEKPKPKTAEVDYQNFQIVEDDKVKEILPNLDDINNANIGNENVEGDKPTDIAKAKNDSDGNGNASVKEPEKEKEPDLPSYPPRFPGGTSAWLSFLQKYLQAPADIEPGQRIEVQVRFWVDIDGSVSRPEIIKSGGTAFDKEVLRVMKKMPRWQPAMQHGNLVAVSYTQPVIFIGEEQ